MKKPRISVVCSVFNGASYLHHSLQSLSMQSETNFEILIIDDGSTDRTPEILAQAQSEDKRFRVVTQKNKGLTAALINGCDLAMGHYIARHDLDDISSRERLTKQAEFLDLHSEVSFVSCGAQGIGPKSEFLFEVGGEPTIKTATKSLISGDKGPNGHGSVMFRRESYETAGGYRKEFYFAQDWDLWLRLVKVGAFAFVPETLYQYRIQCGSVSGRYRHVQQELVAIAKLLYKTEPRSHETQELLHKAYNLRPGSSNPISPNFAAGAYFIGCCLLKQRNRDASSYFLRAILACPTYLRAYAGIVRSYLIR